MDISIIDIQDGKFIIDFNKVYNFWCVYSDGYNCLILFLENYLNVFVKAGELEY